MSRDGETGPRTGVPRPDCICVGLGPELTQLLRRLSPSDDTWQQLRSAEVEVLKAVRALIDERIRTLTREPERGVKVTIE
jgi:hypothetical protein